LAAYAYIIGGDHDFSDPAEAVIAQPRVGGVSIGDGGTRIGAGEGRLSTA
jgi:hypothetical protein